MLRFFEKLYEYTEKLRNYFNTNSHEKNGLIIVLFYVVSRLVALAPISKSGDAVFKWRILRLWAETGTYPAISPEHHQSRWMLNLPVRLLMEIFGTGNLVYYIYPLLCGFVCALCIYFIAARLKDKAAGMTAMGLFMLFPLTTEESIQFLPMIPASAFILSAILCMFRYQNTKRIYWTLLAGILLGLAYGCKFTSVYWFVPFSLYLIFADPESGQLSKKMHFPLALWVMLLGGTAVAVEEFIYLNSFFGTKYGRISMLMSGHFKDRPTPQYLNIFEYLLSFLRPFYCQGKYFKFIPRVMILAAAVLSAILLWRNSSRKNPHLTLILGCFFSVYLLHCYVVYKFFPFLHPERPHARYLLALIITGIVLYAAAGEQRHDFFQKYFKKYALPFQFLFKTILLVVMFIAILNPLPKGENAVQLAKQTVIFSNTADMPVLFMQDEKLTAADTKYAQMYISAYAPINELHPADQRGHLDISNKNEFFVDSEGRFFRYLWGAKVKENVPIQAIVCNRGKCRRTQLVLKRSKNL